MFCLLKTFSLSNSVYIPKNVFLKKLSNLITTDTSKLSVCMLSRYHGYLSLLSIYILHVRTLSALIFLFHLYSFPWRVSNLQLKTMNFNISDIVCIYNLSSSSCQLDSTLLERTLLKCLQVSSIILMTFAVLSSISLLIVIFSMQTMKKDKLLYVNIILSDVLLGIAAIQVRVITVCMNFYNIFVQDAYCDKG